MAACESHYCVDGKTMLLGDERRNRLATVLQPRAASDGTIRDPRRLGLGGSRRLHYLMSISEYFVFWREGCGPCGCDGTNERSAGSCEGAGCRLPRGIPVQHMVLFFFPSAKDEARRVSALRCNLRWPTTHPRARGPEAASQLAVDAVDAVAGGAVRGGSVCQQGFAPSLGRASSGGLVGWWGRLRLEGGVALWPDEAGIGPVPGWWVPSSAPLPPLAAAASAVSPVQCRGDHRPLIRLSPPTGGCMCQPADGW